MMKSLPSLSLAAGGLMPDMSIAYNSCVFTAYAPLWCARFPQFFLLSLFAWALRTGISLEPAEVTAGLKLACVACPARRRYRCWELLRTSRSGGFQVSAVVTGSRLTPEQDNRLFGEYCRDKTNQSNHDMGRP